MPAFELPALLDELPSEEQPVADNRLEIPTKHKKAVEHRARFPWHMLHWSLNANARMSTLLVTPIDDLRRRLMSEFETRTLPNVESDSRSERSVVL